MKRTCCMTFFSTKETSVLELNRMGQKIFWTRICNFMLKVTNSQEQIKASWILPKNKPNTLRIVIICFRDLLTFTWFFWNHLVLHKHLDLRRFEDSNGHSKAVEGLGIIWLNGILVHDFSPNWMILFHLSSTWFSDL